MTASVLADPDVLVEPAFWHCPEYVTTVGPEVVDLGALCGFHANPEQRLLLDGAFGFDKRGRLPFEVVPIASRQNLKTGFLVLQGLGKAILLKRPTQIWTAHLDSATDKAHADLEKLIESSAELSKRVKSVGHGKGSKDIKFTNGCEILFRARTGKGGQSLSADDIDLDELFAAEPQHIGSFMPTMSTRPNAQITMPSSAPHANSAYQRGVMARGRLAALGLAIEPRMLYAEWTVLRLVGYDEHKNPIFGPPACQLQDCDHALGRPGCICDDPALVKLANPSLERSAAPSISWEYIQSERRAMAEIIEMYLRERMGIGETAAGVARAISPDLWLARQSRLDVAPVPVALGVAIDLDRTWASIGATNGTYLGAVRRDRLGPWLLEETKRIALARSLPVGIDEKGPAASLIEPLRGAGVTVVECSTDDYILACADVYDGLVDGRYEHGNHDDLNNAVSVAGWRKIGDRRVWARAGGDITMLEASTLAVKASRVGEVSIFSFDSLDLCDRCGLQPHDDPDGEHDYLCPDCRAKEA